MYIYPWNGKTGVYMYCMCVFVYIQICMHIYLIVCFHRSVCARNSYKAKDLHQWNGTSDVAARSKVVVSPYADALRAGSSARETSNASREIAREQKKNKKKTIFRDSPATERQI